MSTLAKLGVIAAVTIGAVHAFAELAAHAVKRWAER